MMDRVLVIVAKIISEEIIDYYADRFSGFKKVIVSPESTGEIIKGITIYNDAEFLDYDYVKEILDGERVGWYYQQFLKYRVVLALPYEEVLIIDGDSILSEDVDLRFLYSTYRPVPKAYKLCSRILINGLGTERNSYITNQMLFRKSILKQMLDEIESECDRNWIEVIAGALKSDSKLLFSEYQIYGEYWHRRDRVQRKKIRVFRRFDCISFGLGDALEKYDLVSYERQHKTGWLRYLRANFLYLIGGELG